MTQTLENAIASVKDLPEEKQDLIAYMIIEELKDEEIWNKQFSESEDKLIKIAAKVKHDIRSGKITKKGFGE